MRPLSQSINFSYNTTVESAYVITIRGHSTSEQLSDRCMKSCKDVGMPSKVFYAVDGTTGELKLPKHLEKCSYMTWPKQLDSHLSITEVACALSHFALWCHCVEIDQPIVILEHDAIMVQPYRDHKAYNSIVYLGAREQTTGWAVLPIPPHATHGRNYHFICRAHAYAIDSAVAKNMVAHVIKYGIHESLDLMLRADIFPIAQHGMFAYDDFTGTTIVNRKKNPDGGER